MRLSNKIALVTGATSQLGRQFCYDLAKQGALVWVSDLELDRCKEVVSSLNKNQHHHSLSLDVGNPESVRNAFSEIREVFDNRCVSCHSQNPTDEIWKVAPNGVMFDTPEQIVKLKDKVLNRVVITKTMPQANKSGMNQKERDLVEIWLYQGAKTD